MGRCLSLVQREQNSDDVQEASEWERGDAKETT